MAEKQNSLLYKESNFYTRNRLHTLEEDKLDAPSEECGVFGIYSGRPTDTFLLTKLGLYALQHRGQEAAGIVTSDGNKMISLKGTGLVSDVFKKDKDDKFIGNCSIGHVRYSTTGGGKKYNIQPLFETDKNNIEITVAHNGNLSNTVSLREELIAEGFEFRTSSDTEVILKLLHKNLHLGLDKTVELMLEKIEGAYSLLILTLDKLIAVRDPYGIRPLVIGKLNENTYIFCSETCGIEAVGGDFVRFVKPGEMVSMDKEGHKSSYYAPKKTARTCSFEYIYFARPDSNIDDISVYKVREKSGRALYKQMPVEADVVVGVPDSGIPAAIGYSKESGIPYVPALVKNKYTGRSFIIPDQEMRERVVSVKLNTIKEEIEGKRVVVIDDSIVRGTTSKRLVDIFKKAGAKEIHFRSAAPPIVGACHLGIDTPDKNDLISYRLTTNQIKEQMGVDTLDFLNLDNLKDILKSENYCFGCFNTDYPVDKELVSSKK